MAFGLSDRIKAIAPSPTLAIDAKTKELVAQGVDIINLSVGEPDFGTPEPAAQAAIEAIKQGFTKYTAVPGINDLRKAIAKKLKDENGLDYEMDDIIVSNGAKHSLYNAFMAILNPGDEVILPAPYWVSYPEMIRLAEGEPVVIATDESTGFKITPEMLKQAITPKTKALLLNSPSNPTGAVYSPEDLKALAEVMEQHEFYVISDEIYEKMVYGVEQMSIASVSEAMKKRTILVNGFSKAFAMTGWRVGYIAADRAIVKAMTSFQSQTTSNPASISQKAALKALDAFDPNVIEAFRKRLDYVMKRLEEMPLIKCIRPQGAFYVFPNVADIIGKSYKGTKIDSANTFATLLLEKANIALVPGEGFGAPNNIRISYAVSDENLAKAMDRLEGFLKEVE
ncbi:pyridoxal phosphate-dependent aminotransferase [Effusibacillus lacus]|uniref:Aminotransferase n=1 Tax=Effusibacillus lacus TaxID=1348429 RepID=A0A292YMB3_9BACL|nr:pyridoxal phosphate-dependent aminotransferase [Effusibacillus lacus]TCS70517.1 aspartate aminotransferase [Effusibacillus lacus]GAX89534.1 aspartate aminotransferase [Effusibacillus lacus]